MRAAGSSLEDTARGQTLPDFTVAIAIFLLTVSFILLFIPQMIEPFDDQEQSVVAERITSELGNSELTENGTSGQLNESATVAFFNNTEQEALEQVGVDTTYSLNVTIRDSPSPAPQSSVLCADNTADGWAITDCKNGSIKLETGQAKPHNSRSVATTRLTLFTGDRDVVMEVGVWKDD